MRLQEAICFLARRTGASETAVPGRYRCHEGFSAVPETVVDALRYLIKITSFCASL